MTTGVEDTSRQIGDTFVDELEPGTKLLQGQYTIERFINAGGFGITYLARNSLDRKVVIKECFPGSFCRRSRYIVQARSRAHQTELASIVSLFVQEARSLAKLEHPNIVGVHQVFEENNTAYMALDFVEGRDMLDIIEAEDWRLDPPHIKDMLRRILGAVAFIHKEGMLHRDISPDNILVEADGNPILIDFGAAREQASKKSRVLSALRVVKDGYSPQEFYIAGAAQGPHSDLYALGATFYHIITGEVPPNSQARLSSAAQGEHDPYQPLVERQQGFDKAFLASIDKALAVLPKDRMQSADEWLMAIDGREPKALASPSDAVLAASATLTDYGSPDQGADPAPAAPPKARRGGGARIAVLMGTVAAVGVAVVVGLPMLETPDSANAIKRSAAPAAEKTTSAPAADTDVAAASSEKGSFEETPRTAEAATDPVPQPETATPSDLADAAPAAPEAAAAATSSARPSEAAAQSDVADTDEAASPDTDRVAEAATPAPQTTADPVVPTDAAQADVPLPAEVTSTVVADLPADAPEAQTAERAPDAARVTPFEEGPIVADLSPADGRDRPDREDLTAQVAPLQGSAEALPNLTDAVPRLAASSDDLAAMGRATLDAYIVVPVGPQSMTLPDWSLLGAEVTQATAAALRVPGGTGAADLTQSAGAAESAHRVHSTQSRVPAAQATLRLDQPVAERQQQASSMAVAISLIPVRRPADIVANDGRADRLALSRDRAEAAPATNAPGVEDSDAAVQADVEGLPPTRDPAPQAVAQRAGDDTAPVAAANLSPSAVFDEDAGGAVPDFALSVLPEPGAPVVSTWNVVLPFRPSLADPAVIGSVEGTAPNWIREGAVVTAMNGILIDSLADIADILHVSVSIENQRALPLSFTVVPEPGAAAVEGTLFLPVVQDTALLDGTQFRTGLEGGTWRARVTAVGSSAGELSVGDEIVAYMATNEQIDSRDSLGRILQREFDAGITSMNFAVRRDGDLWIRTMSFADALSN